MQVVNISKLIDIRMAKAQLTEVTQQDLPRLACLMDLLLEDKTIAGNETLAGASAAIQELVIEAWDKIETATARLPETDT